MKVFRRILPVLAMLVAIALLALFLPTDPPPPVRWPADPWVPPEATQAAQKVSDTLSALAHEKEYYGFDGVDLDNLFLGPPIPAYEVIGEELVPLELSYYWLMEGDTPVNIAALFHMGGSSYGVTFGSNFMPILSPHFGEGVVLIYDHTLVHYATASGMGTLSGYSANPNRGVFSDVPDGEQKVSEFVEDSLTALEDWEYLPIEIKPVINEAEQETPEESDK